MRTYNTISILFVISVLTFLSQCSSSDREQMCGAGSMSIAGTNSCLSFEHKGLSDTQQVSIQDKVAQAMLAVNRIMPVDNLLIRIIDDPRLVIPGLGIGGYNPSETEILIVIDTSFTDLERSLEGYLFPMIAHEAHHAKRRLSVGYGTTLFEAMVSEGLADHFSMQVAGIEPPPWSVVLTGQELEDWKGIARMVWHETSYDHDAWFFGIGDSIPSWTAYAVGYDMVNTYLHQNPNRKPADLHDEPASSFEF